jgi:hypothetical protein
VALVICGAFCVTACSDPDWRAHDIAKAESLARADISDPTAIFSRVAFTGDDKTGQTCGYLNGKTFAGQPFAARFIVYIDGSAGPYVEYSMGRHPLSQVEFDRAWQNDCIVEGYTA